jgi:DNA (cytosine-5)-methyltransferase 1
MKQENNQDCIKPYKVISTFSGAGGSSLGYKLAGLDVVAANEFVPFAVSTYKANFPNTIMFDKDIRTIKGADFLDAVGLEVGQLDILDGSPPCGAFSMAGLREDGWGKEKKYSDVTQRIDDLFDEYIRLVTEIQPKVFVGENVSGMAMGGAKPYFAKVYRALENAGYNVSCRLLNAQYFNVPQHRPRLIWVGVRKDLNVLPSHPKPQYTPIKLGEALKNVINTPEDIKAAEYPEHYSVMPLIKQMKPGESGSKYHPNGSYFSLKRLDFDKVCSTILQKDATHTSSSALHPIENRKLTIPELRIICTFPDNFIFTGNYGKQWERMGRAVPPLFMKAIAEHIRYNILDKINGITNNYNPPEYVPNSEGSLMLDDVGINIFKEIKPEDQTDSKEYTLL